MNTIKKVVAVGAALFLSMCLLAGCGGGTQAKTVYELPYYDGTDTDEVTGLSEYNATLWRRNSDTIDKHGADPFVLDNSANDGYYYIYVTGFINGLVGYRTKDFTTIECVGRILTGETNWSDYWAPEVISETDEQGNTTYFLYYSAHPSDYPTAGYAMFLATSDSPSGPFELVDFTDAESCGGNTHTNAGNTSYGKYALFDFEAMCAALNEKMGTSFTVNNLPSMIDAHPFVTSNGDKYIYFSLESPRGIVGMKMKNWYSIDYSTVTLLTRVGYYTLEDYYKAEAGEDVEQNEYELMGAEVNEGPEVIEHEGKYYLTFSVNGYSDASYSLMQAVGDSPLGPFTKLGDDQNGLFLSSDIGSNAMTSGTGHHSFFTVGDELYISYHRHQITGTIDGGRMICFDKVEWVETEGENGEKVDVLYVNGPTVTEQPRFDADAEYVNIAEEGTVTIVSGNLENDSSASSLNDGLLSYNVMVSQEFLNNYVKEATTAGEATYEITFDTAREIRGFMVYGSKYMDRYFSSAYDVELTAEENGTEKIYYIEELPVNESCIVYNEDELLIGNYVIENVVYGSGVYAEFDALNIKSIRFSVKAPEGQSLVGISEIAVLGKRA